jgi:hypothetical protein
VIAGISIGATLACCAAAALLALGYCCLRRRKTHTDATLEQISTELAQLKRERSQERLAATRGLLVAAAEDEAALDAEEAEAAAAAAAEAAVAAKARAEAVRARGRSSIRTALRLPRLLRPTVPALPSILSSGGFGCATIAEGSGSGGEPSPISPPPPPPPSQPPPPPLQPPQQQPTGIELLSPRLPPPPGLETQCPEVSNTAPIGAQVASTLAARPDLWASVAPVVAAPTPPSASRVAASTAQPLAPKADSSDHEDWATADEKTASRGGVLRTAELSTVLRAADFVKKESPAEERVRNLCRRFPQHTVQAIEAALEANGGHAGRAAAALEKDADGRAGETSAAAQPPTPSSSSSCSSSCSSFVPPSPVPSSTVP